MSDSILLVFAHPDDETTAVGGTTAKYVRQGYAVDLVTATGGEKGSRLDVPEGVATATVRAAEQCAAAAITGISNIYRLGYLDGELAKADLDKVIAEVLGVIVEVQPQVVITFGPDGVSGHADHVAVSKIATAAFERARKMGHGLRKLYHVAIPESVFARASAAEVGPVITRPDDEITTEIDITDFFETKIRALEQYRSQEDARWLAEMFQQAGKSSWAGKEFFHRAYPDHSAKETDLFSREP